MKSPLWQTPWQPTMIYELTQIGWFVCSSLFVLDNIHLRHVHPAHASESCLYCVTGFSSECTKPTALFARLCGSSRMSAVHIYNIYAAYFLHLNRTGWFLGTVVEVIRGKQQGGLQVSGVWDMSSCLQGNQYRLSLWSAIRQSSSTRDDIEHKNQGSRVMWYLSL